MIAATVIAHLAPAGGVHWADLMSGLLVGAVVGGMAIAWTGRRTRNAGSTRHESPNGG